MNCKECNNPLPKRRTVYCSDKCCKRFLGRRYARKNKQKIKKYNRSRMHLFPENYVEHVMHQLELILERTGGELV